MTHLRTQTHTILVMDKSRQNTHPNHRHPCLITISRRLPAMTLSGRQAIGPGLLSGFTGCPARGWRLPTRAHSGPQDTGASLITATAFTAAIGAGMSATMAALTTVSATSASAMRAVTGAVATSTTTVRSITLTAPMRTTATTALFTEMIEGAIG